jgi:hypothetical protein
MIETVGEITASGLLLMSTRAAMLRITRHDCPETITLQVEGRLVGAWAKELECCWKSTVLSRKDRAPIIDLTEVLFIDEEGKRVLTRLFREGAFFRTGGPMTDAILAEITGKSHCILRGAALPVVALLLGAMFAKGAALKQNPQVQVANLNVAVSQESQVVARSALLPQANFTVITAQDELAGARADLARATGQMELLYTK